MRTPRLAVVVSSVEAFVRLFWGGWGFFSSCPSRVEYPNERRREKPRQHVASWAATEVAVLQDTYNIACTCTWS